MAARMRAHDWSSTPLGPPADWPQSLQTAVSLMLAAKQAMFIAWGPHLAFLYNDAYAPIFGIKHPGALGRPFADVWSDIWDQIKPLVDSTLAGQASWHEDLHIPMRRHGYLEDAWFSFSYTPLRDERGRTAGMFCAATETTSKVVAERRIAAEGERLRHLFHKAPGFICVLRGPTHLIEMANAAYLQLIGNRDVVGRTVLDALPEVVEQGFIELLDGVYASGEPFIGRGMPVALERTPGAQPEKRFVDFIYQPILEEDGQVSGIFVEGSDVTEQKLAEQSLRIERDRSRSILEGMAEGYILLDHECRVLEINAEGLRFERRPASEIVGRLHWEVWPGTEESELGRLYKLAIAERRSISLEHRHVSPDGRGVWLETRAFPAGDGLAVFYRDVTERKEAEAVLEARVAERTAERELALAQLAQAQKMEAVGQLTGGIAHDFNNLLQALSGCLSMIGRRAGQPAIQPMLDAGQQAVDRGAKLVQQLMAFARRESLRPEPIDVRDRILRMSALLERALRADIQLSMTFGAALWPIEVDPTQFELALINLAVNARDAMPDGGALTVEAANVTLSTGDSTGLEGDFVRLSVTDTGVGMPPAVLAKAFDPFFTTKDVGKGSGLGLAQVYGLARQGGGVARIESREGLGTTVIMLLRRSTAAVRAVDVTPVLAGAACRGGRILLVEDDPVVSATVAAALEDVGYEVEAVPTADAALQRLQDGVRIDLLFSDVVTPGRINGVELAHAALQLRRDLRVVLTTGYSERVAQAAGIRTLGKPYRMDELIRVLDTELAKGEEEKASHSAPV